MGRPPYNYYVYCIYNIFYEHYSYYIWNTDHILDNTDSILMYRLCILLRLRLYNMNYSDGMASSQFFLKEDSDGMATSPSKGK